MKLIELISATFKPKFIVKQRVNGDYDISLIVQSHLWTGTGIGCGWVASFKEQKAAEAYCQNLNNAIPDAVLKFKLHLRPLLKDDCSISEIMEYEF